MYRLTTLVTAIALSSMCFSQQTNTNQRSFKIDSNPVNQSIETYNYFKSSEALLSGTDYQILNNLDVVQDSSVIDYFNITDYQNQIDLGQMMISIPGTDFRIEMIAKEDQDGPIIIQTKN